MLVKNFKRRTIMGQLYPIMSNDFDDHAMTGMIVLRQSHALVFYLLM